MNFQHNGHIGDGSRYYHWQVENGKVPDRQAWMKCVFLVIISGMWDCMLTSFINNLWFQTAQTLLTFIYDDNGNLACLVKSLTF